MISISVAIDAVTRAKLAVAKYGHDLQVVDEDKNTEGRVLDLLDSDKDKAIELLRAEAAKYDAYHLWGIIEIAHKTEDGDVLSFEEVPVWTK